MLPFLELIPTHKYDAEMAIFSDGHYSRQTPGSPQFMPPGETLVLRDASGLILFGWVKMSFRADGERGVYCSIFRNEGMRCSSSVILEAEQWARDYWGAGADRLFTYVDPVEIKSPNPGYCFKVAGWKFVRRTKDGKHILEKLNPSPHCTPSAPPRSTPDHL